MIGVLDSGVGGLSVFSEIKRRYPTASVIYLSDKANFPYGDKTEAELLDIVRNAVKILIENSAKIVVLACNSATVSTVGVLRNELNIPIVGIEPAIKVAAKYTKNGKIGMMATKRTTESHDGKSLAPGCKLLKSHNPFLIAKIENNFSNICDDDLHNAMKTFVDFGADSVVLGCTHYHFILSRLESMYPDISFYAPTEAVVRHLVEVIGEKDIELTDGNDIFLCTGSKVEFEKYLYSLLEIKDADIRKI